MTARKNLEATIGYTVPLYTIFENPDGTPQDLTGHLIKVKVFHKTTHVELYGSTLDGTPNGEVDATIAWEDTLYMPIGEHTWVLEHEYPNGDRIESVTGRFTVVGGLNV